MSKAKGLDRRKAVEQAVKELMESDDAAIRYESKTFQRAYKLKTLNPLAENSHESFIDDVWEKK